MQGMARFFLDYRLSVADESAYTKVARFIAANGSWVPARG
jgi:hypothetical protein